MSGYSIRIPGIIALAVVALLVALQAPAVAAARTVTGSQALLMAVSASASMRSSSEIPSRIYVAGTGKGSVRMSADDALVFFCRVLATWHESGALPPRIQLPPKAAFSRRRAPIGPAAPADESEISLTRDAIARQCRAVLSTVAHFKGVPQAVWVDGQRISTAQFLGAVISCLARASSDRRLPEKIGVPSWQAPPTWPAVEPLPSIEMASAGWGLPSRGGSPALTLHPDGTQPVGGKMLLTVSYPLRGAVIEVMLDGARKWIANQSPFSFTWDTRAVKDGKHVISVRAALQDGSGEASVERAFTVKNEPAAP